MKNEWIGVPICCGVIAIICGFVTKQVAGEIFGLVFIGVGVFMAGFRWAVSSKSQQHRMLTRIERDKVEIYRITEMLRYDTDKRTREYAKDLKSLKDAFEEQIIAPDIEKYITPGFHEQFLTLFWRSFKMLEHANKLLHTGVKHKANIYAGRDKIIDAVGENLKSLTETFEGLTAIALTQNETGLDQLRAGLKQNLELTESVSDEMQEYRTFDAPDLLCL